MVTHIDPPANTQSTYEVGDGHPEDTIYYPIVRDAKMAQIVCSERDLVPEESEEECAGDEPAVRVCNNGESSKKCVADNLRTVACDVTRLV